MAARITSDPERYRAAEKMVAEGATILEIMRTLHMDFYAIKRYFPNAGKTVGSNGGLTLDKLDPERFRLMGEMVASGSSISEITRTLKMDHRTVKRHFPHAGWPRGGAGKAAEAKRINEQLRKMDGHGNIAGEHRENGFRPKE